MKKRDEILDGDGEVVPKPAADSDVGQVIYLMEYCRKHEFVLGPTVQVGSVTVQVADPGLRKRLGGGDIEVDIWQAHGHKDG